MGWVALICAFAAVICAGLSGAALFVALALGVLGLGLGLVGYRRPGDPGATRLAGAGGMCLGLIALTLAAARYGLILAALRRLEILLQ
ncbi:MAG TPA: hypothetical protein VNM90_29255 [Haliangium sp.]|nr:hypothetical protein [Haliangium sp.]